MIPVGFKLHFRAILCGVLTVIYTGNVTLQASLEANFWSERRKQSEVASLPLLPASNLPAFSSAIVSPSLSSITTNQYLSSELKILLSAIPSAPVTVQDIYSAPASNQKPVLLIQDVHMNQEAQNNIAQTLSSLLSKKEYVGTVGIEGAFAPLDFQPFYDLKNFSVVPKVARDYFEDGQMAAASYVGLTRQDFSARFVGIDDRVHYEKNVDAYRHSSKEKKWVTVLLVNEEKRLSEQKNLVYSDGLKKFDALKKAYEKGSLNFGSYAQQLEHIWPSQKSTAVWNQFLIVYELEASLNFKLVEQERHSALEKLARVLSPGELENLANISRAYQSSELSFGSFYHEIQNLFEAKHVSLDKMPAFKSYLTYVFLADQIHVSEVLLALERKESEILAHLKLSSEEKKIWEESEGNVLSQKLLDFSLTSNEWAKYKILVHRSDLTSFEKFYEEADIRSQKMVANILSATTHPTPAPTPLGRGTPIGGRHTTLMSLASTNVRFSKVDSSISKNMSDSSQLAPPSGGGRAGGGLAVVVAGGFHTEKITTLLKELNISYVVVSPKITKVVASSGSDYLTVFNRDKTPLDKLLEGEKLFLAPEDQQISNPALRARELISARVRQDESPATEQIITEGKKRLHVRLNRNSSHDEIYPTWDTQANYWFNAVKTFLSYWLNKGINLFTPQNSRGYMNLSQDIYNPIIAQLIQERKFSSAVIRTAKVEPILFTDEKSGLVMGTEAGDRETTALFSAISEHDRNIANGAIVLIMHGLDERIAVVIGKPIADVYGAHYSLRKNQYYIDARHFEAADLKALRVQMHHEIQERSTIFDFLTRSFLNWQNENNYSRLSGAIAILAGDKHKNLREAEARSNEVRPFATDREMGIFNKISKEEISRVHDAASTSNEQPLERSFKKGDRIFHVGLNQFGKIENVESGVITVLLDTRRKIKLQAAFVQKRKLLIPETDAIQNHSAVRNSSGLLSLWWWGRILDFTVVPAIAFYYEARGYVSNQPVHSWLATEMAKAHPLVSFLRHLVMSPLFENSVTVSLLGVGIQVSARMADAAYPLWVEQIPLILFGGLSLVLSTYFFPRWHKPTHIAEKNKLVVAGQILFSLAILDYTGISHQVFNMIFSFIGWSQANIFIDQLYQHSIVLILFPPMTTLWHAINNLVRLLIPYFPWLKGWTRGMVGNVLLSLPEVSPNSESGQIDRISYRLKFERNTIDRKSAFEELERLPQTSDLLPTYFYGLSDPDTSFRRMIVNHLISTRFSFPNGEKRFLTLKEFLGVYANPAVPLVHQGESRRPDKNDFFYMRDIAIHNVRFIILFNLAETNRYVEDIARELDLQAEQPFVVHPVEFGNYFKDDYLASTHQITLLQGLNALAAATEEENIFLLGTMRKDDPLILDTVLQGKKNFRNRMLKKLVPRANGKVGKIVYAPLFRIPSVIGSARAEIHKAVLIPGPYKSPYHWFLEDSFLVRNDVVRLIDETPLSLRIGEIGNVATRSQIEQLVVETNAWYMHSANKASGRFFSKQLGYHSLALRLLLGIEQKTGFAGSSDMLMTSISMEKDKLLLQFIGDETATAAGQTIQRTLASMPKTGKPEAINKIFVVKEALYKTVQDVLRASGQMIHVVPETQARQFSDLEKYLNQTKQLTGKLADNKLHFVVSEGEELPELFKNSLSENLSFQLYVLLKTTLIPILIEIQTRNIESNFNTLKQALINA